MSNTTPNPGSSAAIADGCTCPVLDNAHGWWPAVSDRGWVINTDCPVHGMSTTPNPSPSYTSS